MEKTVLEKVPSPPFMSPDTGEHPGDRLGSDTCKHTIHSDSHSVTGPSPECYFTTGPDCSWEEGAENRQGGKLISEEKIKAD